MSKQGNAITVEQQKISLLSRLDYNQDIMKNNLLLLDYLKYNNNVATNQLPNDNHKVAPGKQQILDIFEIAIADKTNKTAILGDVDGSFERMVLFALATNQITFTESGFNRFSKLFSLFLKQNWIQKQYESETLWSEKSQLINEVLEDIVFLENSPENPVFIGDILYDRNSVNPLLMFEFCSNLKLNNPNLVFIRGNHDSEFWAQAYLTHIDGDVSYIESFAPYFYGNFSYDEMQQSAYKNMLEKLNKYDTYKIFSNCHYDEQSNVLYIHNGITLDPNGWINTCFNEYTSLTKNEFSNVKQLVNHINQIKINMPWNIILEQYSQSRIDKFNNFKPSNNISTTSQISTFALSYGITLCHGHENSLDVIDDISRVPPRIGVIGVNRRALLLMNK